MTSRPERPDPVPPDQNRSRLPGGAQVSRFVRLPRRKVLTATTAAVATAAIGGGLVAACSGGTDPADKPVSWPKRRDEPLDFPFLLGVASGDPWSTSVLLWTRLTTDIHASKVSQNPVPVDWQVAHDDRFTRIVAHGTTEALPEEAHSVHQEVFGLEPDRWYYYRFRAGGHISPVGRTRTAPPLGSTRPASFVSASCQSMPSGFYTAHRRIVEADVDFVAFLGDWIYEVADSTYPNRVREHGDFEPVSVDEYRTRHALYRSDEDIMLSSAALPFVALFDDHEVANDWGGDQDPDDPAAGEAFVQRRTAAFQAFYEHMPLRPSAKPEGGSIAINRTLHWGSTLDLHLVDTRQHRDEQACGVWRSRDCDQRDAPDRQMIGEEATENLYARLGGSTTYWQSLAQQVAFTMFDYDKDGLGPEYTMDQWDGYTAQRSDILRFVADRDIRNLVVLSGDAHTHIAADLTMDMADPDDPVLSSDLVCTSITSGGDGNSGGYTADADNPHLRFNNWQRGFIRHDVDIDTWHCDFKVVEYVSEPGAQLSSAARFVIENGRPGLQDE